MKYAMLVYSDQSAWQALSDEESARLRAESMPRWIALFEEMGKADPNVIGRELASASEAKVVRVVDGQTIVTDGPYAETKEQLGGVFITELARPRRGDPACRSRPRRGVRHARDPAARRPQRLRSRIDAARQSVL